MNSIWSEKEGCCVQFIACKGCHKRGKQDQLIGAEIVCVENPSQEFQKGQVRPKRCFYFFIFSILINSFLLNNSVNWESARDQYIHFFYLLAKVAYFFFIFFLISDIFSIQSI